MLNSYSKMLEKKCFKIIRKRKYMYSTVLYLLKKSLHLSGPTHFKPVMFNQLY